MASVTELKAAATATTWTGTTNTDWSTATNWSNGVPNTNAGSTITIPAGLTNYPIIATTVTGSAGLLIIETGASISAAGTGSLDLNGATITVNSVGTTSAIISCPLILSTNTTITVADNGTAITDFLVSGVISGAFTLSKAGAGKMCLSGANTYTGATTVSAGILNIQNATATGTTAGGVTVALGAALEIQGGITVGAEALSLAGTGISATGALRNISGTNIYGGLITLTAATEIASDAGSLSISNAGTITGATFGLTLDGAGSGSIASIIGTTTGTLTKAGSGTWTLSGANTYTGVTTISQGTLSASSIVVASTASNLGNASSAVVLGDGTNAGTLSYTGSAASFTRGFTVNAGGGGITNTSANLLTVATGGITNGGALTFSNTSTGGTTVSSVISSTGSVVVNNSGAGVTTLSGANTYTGTTTISNGTLSATSIAVATGASNLGNATSAVVLGNGTNAGTLSYTGSAASYTRGFTVNAGGGAITNTTANLLTIATGGITNGGALTFSNTSTGGTTVSSAISSTGSVVANNSGTGITIFSGTNTYTGATTISTGTLQLGSATSLSNSSAVIVSSGATFDLAGNSEEVGSIAGAGTITSSVTGSITLTAGADNSSTTFSGLIQNGTATALALSKSGTGTLTLSGSNTYTGATSIIRGTISASSIVVATGASNLGNATSALILGDGTNAGTLSYTGSAASYTRGFTVNAGSGGVTNTTANLLTIATGGITNGGVLTFSNTSTGGTTVSSVISSTGSVVINNSGAGVTTISNTNTYSGSTTVSSGTLKIGSGTSLANSSAVIVSSGATFDLAGNSEEVGSIAGAGTITSSVTGSITLTAGADNSSTTFSGLIQNGTATALALSKSGTGTLTLSGTNTYTGATTISAGVLNVQNAQGTGTTAGGVTVSSGAALELQGGITVGAEALTLNNTGISSGGALRNISGNNTWGGTITLSTNATRINADAGTLTLSASNAITATNINLTVGGVGNTSVSGTVTTGSGTLIKDGSGTVTLSGTNTYTGATTISAGVLNIQNAQGTGTTAGGVTVSSGAALELQGGITVGAEALTLDNTGISSGGALRNISGNNTWGGTITLSTNATRINADAGTLTLSASNAITATNINLTVGGVGGTTISGTITTGTGTLAKDGSGTVTLSGTNTYTGATTISAGVLNIQNEQGTGTTAGGVTVSSGAALELQGGITVGAEALTLDNTGVSSGGALRNISGNNTWGGTITLSTNATRINADLGTLTLNAGNAITATNINLTVGGVGGTTISGTVTTGTGTLTKDGSGTVTLSGTNTYTGATTISAGVLNIQNAQGTGTTAGGVTVSSGAALELQGGITVGAEALTLNNTGISSGGALRNISGNNTWGGTITLSTNATRINADLGTLTLSAGNAVTATNINLTVGGVGGTTISGTVTTGTGTLTKDGSGTVTLSGTNTYSGGTTLSAGQLNINNTSAIGSGAFTISGGTIDNTTAGSISLSTNNTLTLSGDFSFTGTQALNFGTGAVTLSANRQITASASTLTIGGTINDNTKNLTKAGAGTLSFGSNGVTLNGLTISAGTLTATSGTLSLAGNFSNSGTFTHNSGTVTLNGTAQTISGSAATFNNLSFANSGTKTFGIGTTISGALSIASGVVADLGSYTHSSNTISINGAGQNPGSFGSTSSTATFKNNTYFTAASTGLVNVTSSSCTAGTWLGMTSTDWATASNWCENAVPTSTTDVIIAAGSPNQPTIGAAAECRNLTINSGATLTVSGINTLTVNGNWSNSGTFVESTGTVLFTLSGAQSIGTETFNNLTLGGSGIKTLTSVTVSGVLSMEGTATVSAAPTYGASATLQYNTSTSRTAGAEWITPFVATGGVIIHNTGAITTPGALQMGNNTNVPLEIKTGATLTPGANLMTLHGNFINAGTLTSGSGGITIAGTTAVQSIGGFTTTGTVAMTKTSGTATLAGNVGGTGFTLSGLGGTLNLGTGLTHTFSGAWTRTNGTLEGGSSTLKIGGSVSGATGTFTAGTGTVEWTGASPTIAAVTYNNLILSGSGTVVSAALANLAGNFTMSGSSLSYTNTSASWIIAGNLTINASNTFAANNATAPLRVNGNTVISGTAGSSQAGKIFIGDFTVNAGGSWTEGSSPVYSFSGNLTNNGTITLGGGTISFAGTGKTMSGSSNTTIGLVAVTGTYTNNGTLTVSTTLSGAGTLTQGTNGILNIAGGTFSITGFDASTNSNTVNYTGASQTVRATTYSSLTINQSSGNATLGGATTVNGTLALTAGLLTSTSVNTLTIGASGAVSGGASTSFVNGPVTRTITGTSEYVFPVGKSTAYRPVSFTYASAPGTKTVTVEQFESVYPGTALSSVSTAAFSSRYWNITQSATGINYTVGLNNGGVSATGTVVIVRREGTSTTNVSNATSFNTPTYSTSSSFAATNVSNDVALGQTAIPLTVSGATTANKVYDGSTTATITGGTLVGVTSGDVVTLTQDATFADKNVGTAKTITGNCSLSGANAGAYSLTQPALTSRDITAKALTMSGLSVAASRVYNGNTTAVVSGTPALAASQAVGSGTTVDGKPYTGDVVSITGTAVGTYNTKDVATATTVTYSGLSLTGAQSGNYSLTIQGTSAATITALPVVLSGTRAYNNTDIALASDLTITNNVDGANLTLSGSGSVSLEDVGTRTISAPTLPARVQSASNNTGTAVAASLVVTLGAAPTDGNTLIAVISTRNTAANTVSSISQTGATWTRASQATNTNGVTTEIWYAPARTTAAASVTVTLNQTSVRTSAAIIEYRGILSLSPVDLINSSTGNSATANTGSVTTTQANELLIGAVGLSNSTFTLGTLTGSFTEITNVATTNGTVGNNVRTYALERFVSATGTYSAGGTVSTSSQWSAAIASFKAAIPSGSVFTLGGSAAGNYTLTGLSGSMEITKAAVTVTASAQTKSFGTTAPTAGTLNTNFTVTGLVTTDAASGATLSYSGSTAGNVAAAAVGAYTITPSALTLSSGSTSNYEITYVTGTLTVTPQALTVTASANSKTYGSTALTSGVLNTTFTVTGLISGDVASGATLTYSGSPAGNLATASVGSYTITPSALSLSTGTVGNYSLTYVDGTLTVNAAPLTITGISITNKVYDGTTDATIGGTAAYSGLQNGETYPVSGVVVASFSTAGVATGKTVTISGYTPPTLDYTLTQPSGLTGTITAAPLTITADNVYKQSGVALTTPATGITDFTATGLQNSETVGSVTMNYGTGAAIGAAAGINTGTAVPSSATGGTFAAANYSITYVNGDIIVGNVRYSVATGNWSSTATWATTSGGAAGASVPTAAEFAIIERGFTVTVDGTAACAQLSLGGTGASNTVGTLAFAASGSPNLTVAGSVLIGASGNIAKDGVITFASGSTLTAGSVTLGGTAATPAQGTITMTAGGTLKTGALIVGAGSGTWTVGTGTVELTENNTLPATIFTGFNNLKVSAGTTTSGVSFSVAGTMTVNGTFVPGATAHIISGAGTLTGTGTVKTTLVSATALTTQYSITTKTLTGLTVDYAAAGNQSLLNTTYGNLKTSGGSGTKTLLGAVTVNGNIEIGSGTTLAAGTGFSHALTGNWVNNGSFTASTSTVTLNGATQLISGTGATTFNNLVISSTTATTLGLSSSIAGNLSVSSGSTFDLNLFTANRTAAGGTLTVAGTLKVEANSGGQTGSNFPLNFTTYTMTGGTVNYDKSNGGQIIFATPSYATLALGNTSGTQTASGNLSATTLSNGNSGSTLDLYVYSLSATTITNSGTILTQNTSSTPLPSGLTIGGTVQYAATTGAQTIRANTYTTLTLGNTSGEQHADGNISVTTLNNSNAGSTLNMVTNTLSATTISNSGIIRTQNTSSTPLPTGLTLGGTVQYDALTGGQTVRANTYTTLTLGNTSGTQTAAGNIASTTLHNTTGGILDMVGNTVSGTLDNTGSTIKFSGASNGRAVATGTIEYYGTTQTVATGTYASLNITAAGTKTAAGNISATSLDNGGASNVASILDMAGFTLSATTDNTGATLKFSGATNGQALSTGTIEYTGATQTVATGTYNNLTLNQSSGDATAAGDVTVGGTLAFTAGRLITGANRVIVGAAGNAGTISGAAAAKYVYGNLRRYVSNSAAPTVDYPVGDASNYTPASISFVGTVSGSGYLDVSTAAAQPAVPSGIDPFKYINRKWTITNTGVAGFTSYSPTFTFVAGDIQGSAATASLIVAKNASGTWTNPTVGTKTTTTTQATGLTSFSDFYLGEAFASSGSNYYKSTTTGNWADASTWVSSVDGTNWGRATLAPTSSATSISIESPTTVTVAATATASTLSIASGATLASGAGIGLSVTGNWTNSGTFSAGTGTVTFNGNAAQTINSGSSAFNNVAITNTSGGVSLLTNNLTTGGTFTLNGLGGFAANGLTNTVTGSSTLTSGTYTPGSATQTFNGGLTVNGGTFTGSTGAVSLTDLTLSSGGFTAPNASGSLTITGNWTHTSGAVFTANSGTVTFNGTTTMSGTATTSFNGVTINSGKSLTGHATGMNVAGNWSNSGTFTHNSGTVTFNGGASQTINSGSSAFNNVAVTNTSGGVSLSNNLSAGGTFTLNGAGGFSANGLTNTVTGLATITSGTYSLGASPASQSFNGGLTVNGGTFTGSTGAVSVTDLTLSSGSFTAPNASGSLTITGNWTHTSGAVFTANSGTVIFNGTSAMSGTGTTSFNGVTINSDKSLSGHSTGMNVAGNWTNNGTFTHNGGTVTFNGGAAQSINSGSSAFNNVAITNTIGGVSLLTNNLSAGGTFTLNGVGGFSANSLTNTVTGLATLTSGTYSLGASPASQSFNGGLTVNGGTFTGSTGAVSVTDLTLSSGSFTAPNASGSLTITGNWTHTSGAVFTANSGIVTFNGTSAMSGTGTTSFNGVTINSDKSLSGHSTGMNVAGNWANSGTFTHNSGTVTFNGTSAITGSTVNSFNNLGITGALTAPSAANMNVVGNWSNSGTFTNNGGTVTFNGSVAQTLGGSNTFNNLTVNNSTAGLTASASQTVNGVLNLNTANASATKGALDMGSSVLTMGESATNTGIGDVSGIITRNTIASATDYTFGHPFTTLSFSNSGTLPTSASVKLILGNPSFKTNAINRYYSIIQTGGNAANKINMRVHYLESELNGVLENSSIDFFDYHDGGTSLHDHGHSIESSADNWVELSGFTSTYVAPSTSDFTSKYWTLGQSTTPNFTWLGSLSTDWTMTDNWSGGVPTETSAVVIPDAATTDNDPTLPSSTSILSMSIANAGVLNGGSGTLTLTATSGTSISAWMNDHGTFNAGTSTVVFSGTNTTIGGTTNFNNLTIGSGASTSMADGAIMNIGGTITQTGTLDATSYHNRVSYNGGSQSVINPASGAGGKSGYHELVLSGSGTKSLPGTALRIYSDFILAGTATANAGAALTVDDTTTIGSGTTFNGGAYTHSIKGNWINNGSYSAGSGTIGFDSVTVISGSSTNTFNNVTIGGALTAPAGTLNIAGNWSKTGTFTHSSGTVNFSGSNQSVSGNTNFYHFTKEVSSAAILSFAAGSTQNVAGTLTLNGQSGGKVLTLASATPGLAWTLNPSGTRSVSYVSVSDGTNTNSTDITAANSYNGGNNTKWAFSASNLVWTGAVSTAWNNAANWDNGYLPNSSDNVTVTKTGSNQLSLEVSPTIHDFAISSGNTVNGGSATLTVTGNWTNSGTLTPSTGTVIFPGTTSMGSSSTTFNNLTITGALTATSGTIGVAGNWTNNGTFTHNSGTVDLNGSGAQAIGGSSATTFNTLYNSNGSGIVTTADDINATLFDNGGVANTTAILDMGTYTLASTTIENTGATIRFGGTFNALALNSGTIEYNGTTQTITAGTYANLLTSNSGTKTLGGTVSVGSVFTIGSGTTVNASTQTLNLTGSGTPLVVSGSFTASTSTVNYSHAGSTNITAVNYYDLNISGGNRTLASSGTVGVANVFTPGSGSITNTGSTVDFNGSVAQTIPAFTYNNLNTSTGGTKTLGGTVAVNSVFTIGSGTTVDASTQTLNLNGSGTPLVVNGSFTSSTSTVNYTNAVSATITAASYYNLNTSGGNRTLASSGTVGVANVFTPGSVSFTNTGSTVDFNGSGAQTIPAFAYHDLNTSNGGTKTLGGTVSVGNLLTIGSATTLDASDKILNLTASGMPFVVTGSFTPSTSTVNYSSSSATTITAANYYNLDGTGGDRSLASTGTVGIANVFTPGAGSYTITGSTIDFNGARNQAINDIAYYNLSASNGFAKTPSADLSISNLLTIGAGTTVNMGANRLVNAAGFTTAGTGTLRTQSTNALPLLDGSTLVNWNFGVTFDGSSAQTIPAATAYTGTVTLNNTSGAALATTTTMSGALALSSGNLTIGTNTLTLGGAVSGSGYLRGSNSSNLTVAGAVGTINFDPLDSTAYGYGTYNRLKDLVVNTGASATLGTTLNIVAGTTPGSVTVSGTGTLNTGDQLVLKSDASGTARVAEGSSAGGYISGMATVERYIPATGTPTPSPRWRLLTIPVTGTTIRDAWANGPVNTTAPDAVSTGVGTLLTGYSLTSAAMASASGFDWSDAIGGTYGNIRFYTNTGSGSWAPFSNTPKVLEAPAKEGYMLYVRGDRSVYLNTSATNATTLRPKGYLKLGDRTISLTASSNFAVVGNPFASPIDFDKIRNRTANAGAINTTYFYVWDASLNIFGGYRTGYYDGSEWKSVPGRVASGGITDINVQHIQSGTAVFVKREGSGSSLLVQESDKSAGGSSTQFLGADPVSNNRRSMLVNLVYDNGNGNYLLADGVNALFSDQFADAPTDKLDIYKVNNETDNMSLLRKGSYMAVEARPNIIKKDTLYLAPYYLTARKFAFQIKTENMNVDGITATLLDGSTAIPLDVNGGVTNYAFSSAGGNVDVNRFKIVFTASPALPVNFTKATAWADGTVNKVAWNTGTETNIKGYEVERSLDGRSFSGSANLIAAQGQLFNSYSWTDAQPGAIRFYYRIKALANDGQIKYSNILSVNRNGSSVAGISVYPNPVINHNMQLKVEGLSSGNYNMLMVNSAGQQVFQKVISHPGNSSSQNIRLDSRLAGGLYHLNLIGADGVILCYTTVTIE